MKVAIKIPTVIGIFFLLACGHIETEPENKARLIIGDVKSRARLILNLENYLNQKNLVLAKNTLTQSSELLIQATPIKSIQQPSSINGFEMRAPLRFTLVKKGKTCSLVDEKNKQRIMLANVKCKISD